MIPESNVGHLVLRRDVIEAVAEGKFHIYPVRTIDEGLAILTGIPADRPAGEESVNNAVSQRLEELALGLQKFSLAGRDGAMEAKPKRLPRSTIRRANKKRLAASWFRGAV